MRVGEEARVVSGEFSMLVMGNTHSVTDLKGAPIATAMTAESAVTRFVYLGLPRTAAHPNLAKLYINIMLSPAGQKVLYDVYSTDHYELPLALGGRPESPWRGPCEHASSKHPDGGAASGADPGGRRPVQDSARQARRLACRWRRETDASGSPGPAGRGPGRTCGPAGSVAAENTPAVAADRARRGGHSGTAIRRFLA